MEREIYTDFPTALAVLSERLRARSFSPDEYYVVLVPDRYTQTVERALFSGGGAIDCEVLTLSRLSARIGASGRALSREGAVMLVSRAISEVMDSLEYYRHAAGYYEFAREVSDVFGQISSSALDIRALSASGATAAKLNDLKTIKKKYDELKGDCKDAADRLDALADAISDSSFVRGAHFFAIGYALGESNNTKLNRKALEAIAKNAKSFTYFDALPQKNKRDRLTVYRASDGIEQYKQVAVRIRDHINAGGKYGDVFVVCPYPRRMLRILSEYSVQAYADETDALCDTPPFAVIEKAYRLRSSTDGETLLSLCKNPFSGCARKDADELQAQIFARGIGYGATEKTYSGGAVRAVERAKKLISFFDGGFTDGVRGICGFCDFEGIQARLYPDGTDMVSPIISLVELLEKYGTGETDSASFFSAARAVEIKSLPRKTDRVTVTSAPTLRLTACKQLFVTDFNEGVLPTAITDSGLLDDTEMCSVCTPGGSIEPTVREQNRRARAELKAVINNAQNVFCTFSSGDGAKPASFIKELSDNIDYKSADGVYALLLGTDDAEFIAEYACVPAAARELAARNATSYSLSLAEAAGSANVAARFVDTAELEYKPTVSVSELTHWFECPYKRFLRDAVGVTERRRGRLGAPDFGTVVHEFMKRFIDKKPYDLSRQAVADILNGVLAERDTVLDPPELDRLTEDALRFAQKNVRIIEAGEYVPDRTEYRFSGKTLGNVGTELVGVIDRIDTCGGDARIIDYKTGDKRFSVAKCVSGLDMQLPLYAYALGDCVKGFFYVTLDPRYASKKARLMSGCMVRDVNVAVSYDSSLWELVPSELCSVKLKAEKKTGELVFDGRYKTPVPQEDYDMLIAKCVKNAGIAADEIAEGYIARSPVAGTCSHCPFIGVCGDEKTVRGDDNGENE